MFGFDPLTVTVGTLVWLAFRKQSNKFHGVMTPERENIFRSAMEYCKEPSRLRNLSNLFMQHGLKAESFWLSKRAVGMIDLKILGHNIKILSIVQ